MQPRPQLVAALVVDAKALEHGGERSDRRGPGVEVGRRGGLQDLLERRRAGDERQQRRVGLREAADQNDVLVALAGVADDAVAARSIVTGFGGRAFAEPPKSVRIVDVEDAVVLARERRKRLYVGRVAGHAVDAVNADGSGTAPTRIAQQRLELVQIVVGKALAGGAAR